VDSGGAKDAGVDSGGDHAADLGMERSVCCLIEHAVTDTTAGKCIAAGGTEQDASACESVCCDKGDSQWEVLDYWQCLGHSGKPSLASDCEDGCCDIGDAEQGPVLVASEPARCRAIGGTPQSDAALCESTCCQVGHEVVPTTVGTCDGKGGTKHDAAECEGVCCDKGNGDWKILDPLQCAAEEGKASLASDCEEGCCDIGNAAGDGPVFMSMPPVGCRSMGGTRSEVEACEEACCLVGDEVQLSSAGACEWASGTRQNASACESVCCAKGDDVWETIDYMECVSSGGKASLASDCEMGCCNVLSSVDEDAAFVGLTPAACRAVGGTVYADAKLCEEVCCLRGDKLEKTSAGACGLAGGTEQDAGRCNEVCCLTDLPGGHRWRTMAESGCTRTPSYGAASCDDLVCCPFEVSGPLWTPRPACSATPLEDTQCGHRHPLGAYYCAVGDELPVDGAAEDWVRVDLLVEPESSNYMVGYKIVTNWDAQMARRIYIPIGADAVVNGLWSSYDHCSLTYPDETTCDGAGFWAMYVDDPSSGGGGGSHHLMAVEVSLQSAEIPMKTEMWHWLDDTDMRDYNIDWHVAYECTLKRGFRVEAHRPDGGVNSVRESSGAAAFECGESADCTYLAGAVLVLEADVVPGFRVARWVDRDTGAVFSTETITVGPLTRDHSFDVFSERIE